MACCPRLNFKTFLIAFMVLFACFIVIGFQHLIAGQTDDADFDYKVEVVKDVGTCPNIPVYSGDGYFADRWWQDSWYQCSSAGYPDSVRWQDSSYDAERYIPVETEWKLSQSEYESVKDPILLWWTPFTGERGQRKQCGNVHCYFTQNRKYKDHPNTQIFLFYGTDFKLTDLPLPRETKHEWALLHEESPKNVYLFSHKEIMELFNHTSTFKRESDFPIQLQYLSSIDDLESNKYLVPTAEKNKHLPDIALVNYVQSDCNCPSDRDHFVEMLQRHMMVNSYGKCVHNRELPEHLTDPLKGMDHEDFYKLMARYKFTLVLENGICDDYMTEKLWRPFMLGSVPIILGSPKIKDYLPTEKSAILVSDFSNVKDLVEHLDYLNNNDAEYDKYLEFKRTGVTNPRLRKEMGEREWAINNDWNKPNFIDSYECFLCRRLHQNHARASNGQTPICHQATVGHYGCPRPKRFRDKPEGSLQRVDDDWWATEWDTAYFQAKAFHQFYRQGHAFTESDILGKANELMNEDLAKHHHR